MRARKPKTAMQQRPDKWVALMGGQAHHVRLNPISSIQTEPVAIGPLTEETRE